PRPVIDAHDPQVGDRSEVHAVNQAQNGVWADGSAEVLSQPGTWFAAQEDPDPRQQVVEPFCAAGMGADELGKAFGEDAPATGAVCASKPANGEVDVDCSTVGGQVHEETGVMAMLPPRDSTTQGALGARPGAPDGEGDVARRRLLLLDVQSQASEEFPHSRATPWQLTAKGFAAFQEIPPGHHLLAPKLRETQFEIGVDTGRE